MALREMQLDALQQLGVSHSQIVDYYSKQYISTLVQVGTLALVTWDCITTLDDEIAFFWKAQRQSRWSVARLLFMLNRRLPIIGFSIHVYWRTNRSLYNPLLVESFLFIRMCHSRWSRCDIRKIMAYIIVPMYGTIAALQLLRVWSLYDRCRPVGLFLFTLVASGVASTIISKTLPDPKGLPVVKLAPEILTGCAQETQRKAFESVSALIIETALLTMVFLKVHKSWVHVGTTPLLRALLVDGTAYYVVLSLVLGLEIIADMSDKLYYPIADTNFVVCVGVVACNHLMLSLKEAHDRLTSMRPLSDTSSVNQSESHANLEYEV